MVGPKRDPRRARCLEIRPSQVLAAARSVFPAVSTSRQGRQQERGAEKYDHLWPSHQLETPSRSPAKSARNAFSVSLQGKKGPSLLLWVQRNHRAPFRPPARNMLCILWQTIQTENPERQNCGFICSLSLSLSLAHAVKEGCNKELTH